MQLKVLVRKSYHFYVCLSITITKWMLINHIQFQNIKVKYVDINRNVLVECPGNVE